MPANTAHGYPYPVGTDRVMDGDDAIKALADKVEANLLGGLAGGTATIPLPTTANTPTAVTVTFPVGRFSVPPIVVAAGSSHAPHIMNVAVYTVTAASVILYGNRNTSAGSVFNLGVPWLAMAV